MQKGPLSVAVRQISSFLACHDECLEVSYHSATPHWYEVNGMVMTANVLYVVSRYKLL